MKNSRLMALSALSAASAAFAEPPKPAATHAPLAHVFVIVLENHSRDSVIGSPYMPKLTALAKAHGIARNYYGVTHPSQPNYVAMIAGDTFGVNDDGPHRFSARNLVDQLEPTHTWAAYMESAPKAGYLDDYYPSPSARLYASKHNPFVLFDDIRNDPKRLAKIKPYTEFGSDMASGNVADFVYIVPNQCHDLHGGVDVILEKGDGTPCRFSQHPDDRNDRDLKRKADDFVDATVTAIMRSKAWRRGDSAIFVVADESDFEPADPETSANGGWRDPRGCCDSPTLPAASPQVSSKWPGGVYGGGLSPAVVITTRGAPVVSSTPYNHYSLLTTIEDNWGLEHLGHAGDAAGGVLPMNDLVGR
jgi:hypothetical protein